MRALYNVGFISSVNTSSKRKGGSPGGSVVKNPPAIAGDVSLTPDPGRSRVPQLLSLCSAAQELQLLSHMLQLLKPHA